MTLRDPDGAHDGHRHAAAGAEFQVAGVLAATLMLAVVLLF